MGAMRWGVVLVLTLTACAPNSVTPFRTALPSPSVPGPTPYETIPPEWLQPVPTATPTPFRDRFPVATRDASSRRTFVDDRLGYAVSYWAPWRPSRCVRPELDLQAATGADLFTTITESQERELTLSDIPGSSSWITGWTIAVVVEPDPGGRPAKDVFGSPAELVTIGGREFLRMPAGPYGARAYALAGADRMFIVSVGGPQAEGDPVPAAAIDTAEAMAASIDIRVPARSTAVPAPTGTPGAVAAALADAFARGDLGALGALITAGCWYSMAVVQAGPQAVHPSVALDAVRLSFAQGTKVTVDPTLFPATDITRQPSVRATWTSPAGTKTGILMLGVVDGRWCWVGQVLDRP